MRSGPLTCLLTGLVMLMSAELASAQNGSQVASNAREAAAIARREMPGKILSVKRVGKQFQVKILYQGKVQYFVVRAR